MRPAGERILHIRLAGDRRDHGLDLTGLIACGVHFAPLMDDPALFAKVAIIEDGLGVAWPIQTNWGDWASRLRRSGGLPKSRGSSMQPEDAVHRPDFRRLDQLGVGDRHRMEHALK